MLEIWGRPYSSNVIPVIWTANELGLDYTLQLAGGSFGKLDTDDYAKINPNRMIPAIRDGDFALWESHAIVRFLSRKYGPGTLCPADLQALAVADQWMDWSASRAFPPVIQLFFATVRTAANKRDPGRINALAQEASEVMRLLDAHLANRSFVAGEAFTMGDIPLGCVAYRYYNVEAERPALPHLEAWYQRLAERPAYRRHVMRFFGTNSDEWQALERESASEGVL
ncbi:glutathione S-transferase family protein [Hoeflea poritis]|uniref:Glutathione S-transferase n=1 Tax=Hoeflea poritis TaxID=2993659 RepID=A0ABT4VV83_9HYPH|nr:glutathione S-transferase [Hoeflea poritis]MDA4848631.1 glutathione S-transferase [Hoeflea poritis]